MATLDVAMSGSRFPVGGKVGGVTDAGDGAVCAEMISVRVSWRAASLAVLSPISSSIFIC